MPIPPRPRAGQTPMAKAVAPGAIRLLCGAQILEALATHLIVHLGVWKSAPGPPEFGIRTVEHHNATRGHGRDSLSVKKNRRKRPRRVGSGCIHAGAAAGAIGPYMASYDAIGTGGASGSRDVRAG